MENKMHEAYILYPPATLPVNIESMTSFDKTVIFGTRQGHLLMYTVEQNQDEHKMELKLHNYNKSFSNKPITQVEIIPEYQLLISLTDAVISVHDISRITNCPLVHCARDTKGATIFALDIKRSKSLTGEIALVVRMCVGVKRKLQLWYWKHDEFLRYATDIDLTDVPKTLLWLDNTICIGFRTEYVMYNISSTPAEKLDLFPTSSSRTIDPCIALINDCFAVAKDEYLIAVDPKTKSLQDLNVTGSVQATKADNKDAEPRKTFKSFAWGQPLQVLIWDEPYAVALVNNALEVRVLDPTGANKDTFIQTIPELHKARLLIRAKKGLLFAASISYLWCIQSVDIPKQRQSLLQEKKFQLALQLTNMSDESDEEKHEFIHQIQSLYAYDLFSNKMFKESMQEFFKLETDPCDVIRLFPDLLPQESTGSSSKNYGTQSSTTTTTTTSSSSSIPSSPSTASTTASHLKLESRDLENGLLALIDYLVDVRFNLKKKFPKSATESKPFGQNVTTLFSIIETTLLKCYLQTNDSLVASLLRLNNCHLEESEKMLKKYEKYGELIILYQTKGHHKKALQLLQSQADIPSSSLSGHDRSIAYLQQLGTENKQIIFEFAGWILDKHPEDGLKIFTEDVVEVENLPRAEVLDYLLKSHKSLVIPYLEHVVHVWSEQRPMFHDVLIQQYRDQIEQIRMDSETSPSRSDRRKEILLENTRSKLIEFLKKSSKYTPGKVLKHFPANDLFEERAIILGKLGKHEKVLAIYVQILGDINKAAAYCEEIYNTDEKNGNIYVLLIKTLLVPPTVPPYSGVPLHPRCQEPDIQSVLELLEKNATKLNPHAVLQILPDNIPLLHLRTFLELALHNQLERRRKHQVLKGLLYAENLQTQEQRMHYESKCVLITEYSVCPVCTKKFTNQSAFVRYPNGQIVHYSCQEKE